MNAIVDVELALVEYSERSLNPATIDVLLLLLTDSAGLFRLKDKSVPVTLSELF